MIKGEGGKKRQLCQRTKKGKVKNIRLTLKKVFFRRMRTTCDQSSASTTAAAAITVENKMTEQGKTDFFSKQVETETDVSAAKSSSVLFFPARLELIARMCFNAIKTMGRPSFAFCLLRPRREIATFKFVHLERGFSSRILIKNRCSITSDFFVLGER